MKDLSLSRERKDNNEPPLITDGELEKLSKRCLISLSDMSDEDRYELKVELENMMQCISLVTSYKPPEDSTLMQSQELMEELMYDKPRGFTSQQSFPMRNDNKEKDAIHWRDGGPMEETNSILDHLKSEGKMVQSNNGGTDEKSEEKWFFSTAKTSSGDKSD